MMSLYDAKLAHTASKARRRRREARLISSPGRPYGPDFRPDMRSALVIFPLTHHTALLALSLVGACAGPAASLVPSSGESVDIRAGYYSHALVGRKTASGEPYDPELFTASHPTLPMGTILRVTRQPVGPSVEVRVNDRCGCTHGRQLDLSEAAARQLNILRVGKAQVRIEVLGRRPVR